MVWWLDCGSGSLLCNYRCLRTYHFSQYTAAHARRCLHVFPSARCVIQDMTILLRWFERLAFLYRW